MSRESVWVGPEWQGSKIVGWRYRCLRGTGCGVDGEGLSMQLGTYQEAIWQADKHDATYQQRQTLDTGVVAD